MSKNIKGIPVIYAEKPQQCDDCGQIKESRPYGRKGAMICFDCGEKILDIVVHNMGIVLFNNKGELW